MPKTKLSTPYPLLKQKTLQLARLSTLLCSCLSALLLCASCLSAGQKPGAEVQTAAEESAALDEEEYVEPSLKEKIDEILESHYGQDKRIIGSLLIRRGEETLYRGDYGWAAKNDPDFMRMAGKIRYRIASNSKMYTAVMIMQLVQEGRLSLDDKLTAFFPELKNAGKISVRHLLSHRSGIRDYVEEDADFLLMILTDQTDSQGILAKIASYEPNFEPGSEYRYSNSNYILLSHIIERLDMCSYDEALQKRICKPLGLRQTRIGSRFSYQDNEGLSLVRLVGATESPEDNPQLATGTGGITASIEDVALFIKALFSGRLVSSSSLEAMLPTRDDYGLGIMTMKDASLTLLYGHMGRIDQVFSHVFYEPKFDITIISIQNAKILPVRWDTDTWWRLTKAIKAEVEKDSENAN